MRSGDTTLEPLDCDQTLFSATDEFEINLSLSADGDGEAIIRKIKGS
jgi:hypothetical protein